MFVAAVTGLAGLGLVSSPTALAQPGSAPALRSADTPASELSVSTRLADRREVAAGTRAQSLGFEDGGFYANGWHITGEMGGVWAPPVKLIDGVWFGLDDQWVGPAKKFTSGWGFTRYDLPTTAGLGVSRTDVAPDGRRGVLFGLTIDNPGAARTTKLTVDTHSELMGQFPWGFEGITPNASDNLPDQGTYDGRRLVFTDDGALPGAPTHHYAAAVGTSLRPATGDTGPSYWGPRPGHRCTGKETGAPSDPKPSVCDDGPFGNGTGGRLKYEVSLPAHASRTVWLGVAGSDRGGAKAEDELAKLLRDPNGELAAKVRDRRALADQTRLSLPGDPTLAQAVDWGKQNMADLTQQANDLQIRWTNQGKQFPAPVGTVDKATWVGAGYPDYPWIFGTDAEYTAFAAVSVGQFDAIEGHLNALREISDLLNNRSGVVTHEVVSDGSTYFGHDSRQTNPDGRTATTSIPTKRSSSPVRLPWSGAGLVIARSERELRLRGAQPALRGQSAGLQWRRMAGRSRQCRADRDGSGEVGQHGVLHPRALRPGRPRAVKGDRKTYGGRQSRGLAAGPLRSHMVVPGRGAVCRLPRRRQRAVVPEALDRSDPHGRRAGRERADRARAGTATTGRGLGGSRECLLQRDSPAQSGAVPHRCGGGPKGAGERVIFGLTTSIQSVGEGNYGRLGQINRVATPTRSPRRCSPNPRPAARQTNSPGDARDLSLAGSGSEHRSVLDLSLDVHAGMGQLRTAWPSSISGSESGRISAVAADVVPQVPADQEAIAGRDIRLGNGSVDVEPVGSETPIAPRSTSTGSPPPRSPSVTHCPAMPEWPRCG